MGSPSTCISAARSTAFGAPAVDVLTVCKGGDIGETNGTSFATPQVAATVPHGDFTPACGGVIAVVTGGRDFRIRFFDMAGRPRGELEQAIQGEPVTRNEWQAYLSGQPPEIRRLVERRTPPTRHAAVQALRLTSDGHLWVRTTFHGPGVTRDTWHTWRLEWNGDALAVGSHRTVQLPSRFTVHDAHGELVWGIHRGEYDIPTARAYRLPWPAARGCLGT
jgi:hypothetical protein